MDRNSGTGLIGPRNSRLGQVFLREQEWVLAAVVPEIEQHTQPQNYFRQVLAAFVGRLQYLFGAADTVFPGLLLCLGRLLMLVPMSSVPVWTFHNTAHALGVVGTAIVVVAAVVACGPDSSPLLDSGSSPEIEQQSPRW